MSQADRAHICVRLSPILILAAAKGFGLCAKLYVAFYANDSLIAFLQHIHPISLGNDQKN